MAATLGQGEPLLMVLSRRDAELVTAALAALRVLPKLLTNARPEEQQMVTALLGVVGSKDGWKAVDRMFDATVEYLEARPEVSKED